MLITTNRGSIAIISTLLLFLFPQLVQAAEHETKDGRAFAGAGWVELAMSAGLGCILPAPVEFGQTEWRQILSDRLIE